MTRRLIAAITLVAGLLVVLAAGPAMAHPLGNFTTNTSAAVLPSADGIAVVFVLDLAEIPTQQTRAAITAAGGNEVWAQDECERIAGVQTLAVNGSVVPLVVDSLGISFLEGQAGLETLRLRCNLLSDAVAADGPVDVAYSDGYEADRIGWREVLAAGDGVALLSSDVPDVSVTEQLRNYPTAEVSTVTAASLSYDPSATGPSAAAAVLATADTDLIAPAEPAAGLEGLVDRYTELVSRQDLTVGFVLLAIFLAILLGTAHAVAPGHGKTVIAAYLLGEGGEAKQAIALGGTVAITHTIGVLALGVLVQTSSTLAPESLYPILGVIGGVLFMFVGVTLLYRAIKTKGHGHSHDHDHDHVHGPLPVPVGVGAAHTHTDHGQTPHGHADHGHVDHGHVDHGHVDHGHADQGHDHDDHVGHGHAPARSASGWRMLVLPGLAGGMVPSPSALLVLLGGIAIGRTWFGVLLVMAYGVGMALALVGAGYLLHRVRFKVAERLESKTWARVSAALPVMTSSLIIVGGLVIVARSLIVG